MTPTDRKAFLEVVIGFAELKGKQLAAAAMELYWRSLQHWDLDDFRAASEQLLRSCEFMPTPKDFEDLRKAGRPTPGEAWAKVLHYVRHGYNHWDCGRPTISMDRDAPKKPDDLLIDRAVEAIGGYDAIAMSNTESTHFLERRFCEHYEAIQDANEIRDAVPQITNSQHKRLDGPKSAAAVLGRLSRE
jgi:hypothetical protein